MKIGDCVEVVAVPGSLPSGMGTQGLFEACLGRVFPVAGLDKGFVAIADREPAKALNLLPLLGGIADMVRFAAGSPL
jgi:hypothetical protein